MNEIPEDPIADEEQIEDTPAESEELIPPEPDHEAKIEKLSRRSFVWAGAAVLAAYTGLQWFNLQQEESGTIWPLRKSLEVNEELGKDLFKSHRLAPTFDPSQAQPPRFNGDLGLSDDFNPDSWKLKVMGTFSGISSIVKLDEIKKLPKYEMITEFKCIEGWSVIIRWAGARMADFIAMYPPATQSGEKPDVKNKPEDLVRYLYMETPDKQYYVGLDMPSAMHPQTLLCYEMDGKPLEPENGAPLRLAIPVKYGIKNIKRIGLIKYTNTKPADYWAEQGYDWYAGH